MRLMLKFKRIVCHHFSLTRLKSTQHIRAISNCKTGSSREAVRWSYLHGASSIPLLDITVGQLLEDRAFTTPDRTAAVFCDSNTRLSFSQLLEKSDQLAAGLLSLGVKKGDRVGVWGSNSVEWLLTQYATARAGFILVNINPRYVADDLAYAINKVGCKALVASESVYNVSFYGILKEVLPDLNDSEKPIKSERLPSLSRILMMGDNSYPGTLKFDDVLNIGSEAEKRKIVDTQRNLCFDTPVNIQFTSGTTGRPKAVTLTHHNVVNNAYFVGLRLEYDKQDTRICMPVPLYHCFGMVIGSMQIICHGACLVSPAPLFDSTSTLTAIHNERCTALYGVPTMFIDILNNPRLPEFDVSSLYTGIMGGSPCPQATMEDCIKKLNMSHITVCYGSTETSPVSFQSFMTDSVEKRVSTVGRVHAHIEAKVIDDQGQMVPCGKSGELMVRGYINMLHYWYDPEETTKVLTPDHWYHSGDLAIMDEEGFCKIIGRKNDMIIRGGENIYPAEVENILIKHPDIVDVQIVGVPDSRLGEEVCACVKTVNGRTTSEVEIREFCKDKMARYKIPNYILLVEEFPLTATGKVQKYKLRDYATEKLKLRFTH